VNISEDWTDSPYPAPPDRLPPVPRRVAWNNKARWLRTGLVAGLLFAPNAILAWGWQTGNDLRELEARGETISGKVLDKTFYLTRGETVRKVVYSFEVRRREFKDVANLSAEEFAACHREGPISVTYLRDRPAAHCTGHPGPQLQLHNAAYAKYALIAAAGCAVVLAWFEFRLRRERFLARQGEAALGRITERGTSRAKNRTLYWVSHAFTAPDGQPLTGWHYVPSPLWERLRPSTRVTLLYDPAHPGRHLPLYAFEYAYIVEDVSAEWPEDGGAAGMEGVEGTAAEERYS
jgi:hypothetical protein